jgi:hypothetical protein
MTFPKLFKACGFILLTIAILMFVLPGCTPRPSPEQLSKLDETTRAAEDAERKLNELRSERAALESTLEEKNAELRRRQEEQEAIKAKLAEEEAK